MTTDSTRPTASSTEGEHFLCDDWFDPLENGVRTRIRGFIEELLEAELDAALGRARYERPGGVGDEFPEGGRRLASWPSGTSPFGHFRRHDGSRAARPAADPRRQDEGMAERDLPRLPAADETGRRLDRGRISFGDQHASGALAPWRRCSAARWGGTRSAGSWRKTKGDCRLSGTRARSRRSRSSD